jgi:hypothetical protein
LHYNRCDLKTVYPHLKATLVSHDVSRDWEPCHPRTHLRVSVTSRLEKRALKGDMTAVILCEELTCRGGGSFSLDIPGGKVRN